jgi:hypothetical protein
MDNWAGGIWCGSSRGPSFGYGELWTDEPLLGEGNVRSVVGRDGFMIGGTKDNFKEGDINPLTGDKLNEYLCSKSTAREIEVWKITFLD